MIYSAWYFNSHNKFVNRNPRFLVPDVHLCLAFQMLRCLIEVNEAFFFARSHMSSNKFVLETKKKFNMSSDYCVVYMHDYDRTTSSGSGPFQLFFFCNLCHQHIVTFHDYYSSIKHVQYAPPQSKQPCPQETYGICFFSIADKTKPTSTSWLTSKVCKFY